MEIMIASLLIILILIICYGVWLLNRNRQNPISDNQINEIKNELEQQRSAFIEQTQKASALQAEKNQLIAKLEEEKSNKNSLDQNLTVQFENMAYKILEHQSKNLKSINVDQIGQILNPLRDKIKDFQSTITSNYENESQQRAILKSEIQSTMKMNEQLSEEARNLTKALKGDKKLLGNLGELKLEKILESAGLTRGKEYQSQVSLVTDDRKRQVPDYTINLPGNRCIILDSKVTLNSWIEITKCGDEEQLPKLQQEFFNAINNHVDTLYKKAYQQNSAIDTADYVLMFLPFDSICQYLYENNQSLVEKAMEKGVVIISSSGLFSCLKTISTIWRKEDQNLNAKKIADEGGKLYEKFVGFVQSMDQLGSSLDKAKTQYDKAYTQLASGNGNLVSKAEKLKKLGVKTNKSLPQTVVDDANVAELSR